MEKRKLIEVALPLEAINRESAREKNIRQGHPATLHLWWARRPLAAARAVLFAQLVDDPSARPEEFPTEELQRKERDRLHKLIERLVVWENTRDEKLLAEAHAEILKSTDGNPPPILDPFCGGGTIPLEAQRLGLEAHASDLNPVAVLITKALIEIPPKFCDEPPVFPGLADSEIRQWKGAEGLAADVQAYGSWLRNEAERRVGDLYPSNENGTVIAYIWARTVTCPNPACSAEVPLISSLDLSTKKGDEVWLRPVVTHGQVAFEIEAGPRRAEANKRGQGARFECWVCGAAVTPIQVHTQLDGKSAPPHKLLAVVTTKSRRRSYSMPTGADQAAADSARRRAGTIRNDDVTLNAEARGTFGGNALGRRYGFFTFADYFTDRQLIALTVLSNLVGEGRSRVIQDGGTGQYADAIATYLGLGVSRTTDLMNSLVTWSNSRDQARNLFSRQAISMAWDYVEVNPFSNAAGDVGVALSTISKALLHVAPQCPGYAVQADASSCSFGRMLVGTDPPYYDNIVYSDLADFFYVWIRRSLRPVYPGLLGTVLVPKAEELVANKYRHGGQEAAEQFFEDGFRQVFRNARAEALQEYPITVYYAFKQNETNETGRASTGWESLLEGMIESGWEITSTWPLRSERGGRMISVGTNALASAIVLSLRPRSETATTTDRRSFIAALQAELPAALRKLQQGQIAPVDLPQAAIGPGMAVFSRYKAVLEPDGTIMTVRSALSRINAILEQVLNEQEGDFDPTSRFAIAWYRQRGYGVGKFGDADILARALNTSVEAMERAGILTARAGKVQLVEPQKLRDDYDPRADLHTSNWEALHYLIKNLEAEGIATAGDFLREALSRPDGAVDADLIKELAHLLFRIAEDNGWTKDALSFNSLVTSWPEIAGAARSSEPASGVQSALDYEEGND